MIFNQNIQHIRTTVEHVFLLKNKFSRFSTRWDRPWFTLIQHFHIACAIHNMLVAEHLNRDLPPEIDEFFIRCPMESESEEDNDDQDRFANFPIHALRARLASTTPIIPAVLSEDTMESGSDSESSVSPINSPVHSPNLHSSPALSLPSHSPSDDSPTTPNSSPSLVAESPTLDTDFNIYQSLSQGRMILGKRTPVRKNFGTEFFTF